MFLFKKLLGAHTLHKTLMCDLGSFYSPFIVLDLQHYLIYITETIYEHLWAVR